MSATIGYVEAWARWFAGQEVDPGLGMGPLTILWWGRTGKIATFIGGATVVLDLIGSERVREWGSRLRTATIRAILGTSTVVILLMLPFVGRAAAAGDLWVGLVVVGVALIAVAVIVLSLPSAFAGIGALLANPVSERWARWLAVVLLFAGFHLDLMSS